MIQRVAAHERTDRGDATHPACHEPCAFAHIPRLPVVNRALSKTLCLKTRLHPITVTTRHALRIIHHASHMRSALACFL